ITLNRPDNRNALSVELVDSLGDNLQRALDDDSTRVLVLTNNGPAFCAGADLKGGATSSLPGGASSSASPRHDFVGVLETILDAPKPVIGRIAGHCMGGGVGLAAACDISLAADDIRIGFT